MVRADVELRGKRGRLSQLETPAVHYDKGAQFAGFFALAFRRFDGMQKDGAYKHGQANHGGKEAAPGTEWQNDECRAANCKEDAEEHPGAPVAAQMQQFWDEQDQCEKSSHREVTKPFADALR